MPDHSSASDHHQDADVESPSQLVASHSHLFRGARLVGDLAAAELAAGVALLSFSDGTEVEAEILVGPRPSDRAIAVPPYETAAGNIVAAAVWPIMTVTVDDGQLLMRIGQRLA